MHEQSNEMILYNRNLRLCQLRRWSNYQGFGFHLAARPSPPHLIYLVESNSPAAVGGLKIRDVLLAINDENVWDVKYEQVIEILKGLVKRNTDHLKVLVATRKSYQMLKEKQIKIDASFATIMNSPSRMPADFQCFSKCCPRTCRIQMQSGDRNFGFDVVRGERYIGMYIQEVMLDSPASRAGLRKCDRIIKINDKDVDQCETRIIYDNLNAALMKRSVKLLVMDTETYKAYRSNDLGKMINLFANMIFFPSL